MKEFVKNVSIVNATIQDNLTISSKPIRDMQQAINKVSDSIARIPS